jgi:hypothetical protein
VLRGGSWYNNPQNCRVANRNNNSPQNRNNNIGFRVLSQLIKPDGCPHLLNSSLPGPALKLGRNRRTPTRLVAVPDGCVEG